MDTSTPYYAAFFRALVVGALAGISTFLATWSTTEDAKTIGIAAATAFLAPFLARFGGEGTYDTNRDAKVTKGIRRLNACDVGYARMTAAGAAGPAPLPAPASAAASPDAPPAPVPAGQIA